MKRILPLLSFVALSAVLTAQTLPAPQKSGGLPLMDALARRATARAFDPAKLLPPQDLANLLWAAFGVNRPDGRRTAPSAHDARETEIYVLRQDGVFVYDAPGQKLNLVSSDDVRALGGQQPFVKDAPVTLIYVADLNRLGRGSTDDRKLVAYMDAGFIAQNALLYCASAGLASGVRLMVDRDALAPKLKLREGQIIVLAQSVGYPAH